MKCKVDKYFTPASVLDKITTWVSKRRGECIFDSMKDAEKCVQDKEYISSLGINVALRECKTNLLA